MFLSSIRNWLRGRSKKGQRKSLQPLAILLRNQVKHGKQLVYSLLLSMELLCEEKDPGLSLKTGLSTAFVCSPTGSKADALRFWFTENMQQLCEWQDKCVALNTENTTRTIAVLGVVQSKKPATLWQEEKFWVKAHMPNLCAGDVYTYVACSSCNRGTDVELGADFTCYRCNGQQTKQLLEQP